MARESSAQAAGDQTAIDLQDAHLRTLENQENIALRSETTAGKQIARLLRANHIAYRLTKSESRIIIAAVKTVLSKQGITTSRLAQAGVVLKPAAVDLLTALLHG